MSFLFCLVTTVSFVVIVWDFWRRSMAQESEVSKGWIRNWISQGVVIPSLLWIAANAGLSERYPPLMPEVEAAIANGTGWLGALFRVTGSALIIIGSYWAALTFGWWILALFLVRSEYRAEYRMVLTLWSVVLVPFTLAILWLMGLRALGFAMLVWFYPIAHNLVAYEPQSKHTSPVYSRAIAYLKFGKYSEAESAVISELEKCEDDFNGWMMLAELYANQYRDVAEAERTIRGLCAQPNISPSDVAVALHRLADWELNLRDDPQAARKALEQILRRYPGSHLARMAQLRIQQLPATKAALLQLRQGRTIHLPTQDASPGQ